MKALVAPFAPDSGTLESAHHTPCRGNASGCLRYRDLCLKHHPDKGGDADHFQACQQAYNEALTRSSGEAPDAEVRARGDWITEAPLAERRLLESPPESIYRKRSVSEPDRSPSRSSTALVYFRRLRARRSGSAAPLGGSLPQSFARRWSSWWNSSSVCRQAPTPPLRRCAGSQRTDSSRNTAPCMCRKWGVGGCATGHLISIPIGLRRRAEFPLSRT